MSRTKVFVSYSREDEQWLRRFSQHTAVLERRGLVDVWSDTRIAVGDDWEREIESSLTAARVAVLLVSSAFLASDYIWRHEMPRIVAHSAQGMDVLPLILRPCAWQLEDALARLQARPSEGRPLSLGSDGQIDSDLSAFVYELAARIGKSPAALSDVRAETARATGASTAGNPVGEWDGNYNRTRPVRLLIYEADGERFRGRMEYPAEGTVTNVEGIIHDRWSPDDPAWAQVRVSGSDKKCFAISFRETDYENKGSGSISFDGEYRALMREDEMAGAWFSGTRLVGSFTLHRN